MLTREDVARFMKLYLFQAIGVKLGNMGKAGIYGLFALLLGFLPATVVLAADLSVSSYTWTPDPVTRGGSSTFTAQVTNNDVAETVNNSTLVVELPSNVDFSASVAPTDCVFNLSVSPKLLTCTRATLLTQAVWTTTFLGNGSTAGVATTKARISAAGNTDANAGNDELTKNTTVINGANLTISKTGPATATAGDVISFTLTVTNVNGPDPATTFRVIDNLPFTSDFTYQSYSGSNWSCSHGGTTLTCDYSGANIASGAAAPAITVTGAIITSAGNITNGASVASTDSATSDPDATNNGPSQVVVTVAPGTSLRANKTMVSAATGLTTYATGEAVTLTLSATNLGPQNATGVVLTDTVPADFSIGALPLGVCSAIGQAITCTVGALANGATSSSFTIPLTVTGAPGSDSNTATISRTTPATGSNQSATVNYSIASPFAHLTLTKSKGPNPVAAGGNITNTIIVTNSNTSTSAATGVIRVTDALSANETYVSFTGAGWSCSASGSPQTVTCDNSNTSGLARGASLPTLTITTQAAASYLGTLSNTACTGQSAGSPHLPADNSSTENCQTKSVISTPRSVDLVMAKSASLATLDTTTNTFSYTLTVSNATSTDVAPTATVTDTLQAWYSGNAGTTTGSAVITGAAGGESCSFGSSVSCTLLDVTNGAPRTITITVNRPIVSGDIANTASVSSPDAIDSNSSNNSYSASIAVDPIADVTVSDIAAAPNPVKVGVQLTYTTSIHNNGPSTAAGVILRQRIDPLRMTYVASSAAISGTAASCSYVTFSGAPYAGDQGVECTGFSLSNGESRQLVFKVIPFYPYPDALDASYTSNANISTTTVESDAPGYANNSRSNTVTVTTKAIDLTVTNDDPGFDPTAFGGFIDYTVVAQNNGPSQATGFMLTVTPTPPPQGAQANPYTMVYNAAGSILPAVASCSVVGSDVVCYMGADRAASVLAASSSKTFKLRFDTGPLTNVPASSITYKTTAAVESYETGASPFAGDTLAGNNAVPETTTVLPKTDLSVVAKTVSHPVVDLNQEFTYTITVANAGPSDASGVRVTDELPNGFVRTGTAISVVQGSGVTLVTNSCNGPASGSGGTVTCDLGVLPRGGDSNADKRVSITIPVRAAYQASGTYAFLFNTNINNTASIAPLPNTSLDIVSGNNSNSVTVQVRKNSLAGTVYADNDLNDSIGAGEGISGVTLTLTGTDSYGYTYGTGGGQTYAALTTTTNASGVFTFDKLPPGTWKLVETQPSGYWDRYETVGTAGGAKPADTCDGTTNCASSPAANTIGDISGGNAITLPAATATDATGYVFQEVQRGQVSGYIYYDANNDGQRAGATGIGAGLGIALSGFAYNGLDVCTLATCSITTDASGQYSYSNLPPSNGAGYTLTQNAQPTGYLDGKEENGSGTVVASSAGRTPPETIAAGVLNPNGNLSERNFGELLPATLSGYVFVDITPVNAARDAGETAGATGVIVRLSGIDDLSNPVAPPDTTTGANGGYSFTGLRPGTYAVTQVSTPAGLTHTGAQAGANGGTISGSVRTSGTPVLGLTVKDISAITIAANDSAINYNFGESGQGLAGFVYVDLNNNGVKDAGEPGITGVQVTLSGLTSGGASVCIAIDPNPCTVTTGASGAYSYINLPASNGAGYTLTQQSQASAPLSNYVDGSDGASPASAGSLGGTRGNDVLSGIVLTTGGFGTDYNFGEQGASLTGRVYHDRDDNGGFNGSDSGILGVRITLSGTKVGGGDACAALPSNWCIQDSAADGTFSFTGLPAGSYTLTETQPADYANRTTAAGTPAGTASTTTISSIPLTTAGASGTGYLFGEKTGTITGFVWHDVNNDSVKDVGETTGISGVTLTLSGHTASNIDVCASSCPTATTASDGSYSFTGLRNADATGYTIAETQPADYLDGKESAGSQGGNATVNDRISTIPFSAASSATDYNFGEVLGTSISGKVWHDFTSTAHPLNSVKDADEPGLGAVTITLTGTDDLSNICNPTCPTRTTAADGTYSFTGLRPGTYTVTETQPSGINDFSTNTGTLVGSVNGGTVGNAGAGANVISAIVLASGNEAIHYDFREDAAIFVGGYVYRDVNGSHGKDAGDLPLNESVTLTLTGGICADGTATCATTSAADGSYLFAGLRAGTYTITETHPVIYADADETAGSGGGSVDNSVYDMTAAHNRITGIVMAAGSQGSGYNFGELTGVFATVSGKAWINTNTSGSRTAYDVGDTALSGWTVELVHGGAVAATTTTGSDGNYTINTVTPDYNYSVRFRNPANNLIWGNPFKNNGTTNPNGTTISVNASTAAIEGITVPSNGAVTGLDLPIDPAGVVYDAITRAPVAGAVVTIGCPGCVGFDASDVIGDSLTQTTGADGIYQFFLKPGAPSGTYTLSVVGPAGYVPGVSAIIPQCTNTLTVDPAPDPALVQDDANPPVLASTLHVPATCPTATGGGGFILGRATTLYYTSLVISTVAPASGNLINNHLPIDPILGGAIRVTKTTPLINVAKGDLVPYTITATNTLAATLPNINLQDLMPPGFKYKTGSAKLNGTAAEPAISARQLTWANQTFTPNEVKTIKLMLVVGAGVGEGQYTNQAWAINNIVNSLVSNTATATVRVVPDPTFDCSDLIGKVFDDQNANGYQDEGEPGIANVRVATARGLLVTTDKDGRFHVACADIPQAQRGSNFIMKLDERSLPSGYRITTENPREVRTTRGKMVKLNFGAAIHRVVRLELSDTAFLTGKREPAAALASALDKLPETLRVKPSVVRLAYQAGKNDGGLAKDRLRAVRERLEELWKAQGCCYTLVFEEEIFERAATKKGGAK